MSALLAKVASLTEEITAHERALALGLDEIAADEVWDGSVADL